jgi:phage terminase Nu1 subunit (DNA packaging protein)
LQTLARWVMRLMKRMREGRLFSADEVARIDAVSAAMHGREPLDFTALSDSRLAAIFGVAPRTVVNWHSEGLPANPDKTHRSEACIRWYVERGGERAGAKPVSADRTRIEVRLLRAKTRREEIKARREAGAVIDRQAMTDALSGRIAVSKTILDSSVERRALQVPAEHRSTERQALEREVDRVLNLLADVWADPTLAEAPGMKPPISNAKEHMQHGSTQEGTPGGRDERGDAAD